MTATEKDPHDRLDEALARIAIALSETDGIGLAADLAEAVADVLEDRAIDAAGR